MLYDLFAATQSALDVDFCESLPEDDCTENILDGKLTLPTIICSL